MSSSPMTTTETMVVTTRISSDTMTFNSVKRLPGLWRERAAQRRQLRALDDWQLNDLGLTRANADLESRKPFWRA